MDGDEKSDAVRLLGLIKSIGASVDNEVDEHGELRVNGEIPNDARPRVTQKTNFVVVGKIPQPADLTDPDEIQESLKIAEHYFQITIQAKAIGVRIISLQDFLKYIGYERVDRSKD
jgi:hypothetical protein